MKSFGEQVKAAAAYAFLATIFMAGFGMAAAIWSSSLSPLQSDLSRIREERDRKEAELNQIKADYAFYRSRQPPPPAEGGPPKSAGVPAIGGPPGPPPAAANENSETIAIRSGASADVLGGAVTISVIAIPFGGDPLQHRHTVVATVGATGYPPVRIENKDVGFALQFKGSKRFEIRILAAETFTATFRVTVLD